MDTFSTLHLKATDKSTTTTRRCSYLAAGRLRNWLYMFIYRSTVEIVSIDKIQYSNRLVRNVIEMDDLVKGKRYKYSPLIEIPVRLFRLPVILHNNKFINFMCHLAHRFTFQLMAFYLTNGCHCDFFRCLKRDVIKVAWTGNQNDFRHLFDCSTHFEEWFFFSWRWTGKTIWLKNNV